MPKRTEREFIDNAVKIVEEAKKRDIVLRIIGAIALKLHCPKYKRITARELSDIDLVGYSKQKSKHKKLLAELGFQKRPQSLVTAYSARDIYSDPEGGLIVDIFLDELRMCHTVNFRGRLELDHPTISLADILLSKMQIVELNEKDVKDMFVLLREHNVGDNDNETINRKYITDILSKDWGFYYTVTTNLTKVKNFLSGYKELAEEDRNDISAKIDNILEAIEKKPKSFRWKARSRIGTAKKWYRDIEIVSP